MNTEFKEIVDELDEKYKRLISMTPLSIDTVPKDCPEGAVYMFSENGKSLYVGRTKLNIRTRLKQHVNTALDCPFAWHLTRELIGKIKASYKTTDSRKDLLSNPKNREIYDSAKERIRKMEVRYVPENKPKKQAVLEIYVSIASQAKYNDWETH